MRDLADWRLHAYAIIDISRILQLTLISFQEENGKNEKQISCYILQWNIWLCLWILLQLYTLFPNTYSWHHNMVRWLTQDSWNQLRTLPKQGSKPFFFFFFFKRVTHILCYDNWSLSSNKRYFQWQFLINYSAEM